jgi:hypothetical protein
LPFGSNVAVWFARFVFIEPVRDQVPVSGSYSSALDKVAVLLEPPAINTFPLGNSVAVWLARLVVIDPVSTELAEAGS